MTGSEIDASDGQEPAHPWRTESWRNDVARKWATGLGRSSYIPMPHDVVEVKLRGLVDLIAASMEDPSSIDESGRTIGSRLVDIDATGEASLTESLRVLGTSLVDSPAGEPAHAVLSMLTSIAAGYAAADRANTFKQQETLKRALLRSKLRADRELEVSEERFREVFTSTPIGVAICDLDGTFVEVNPALVETLGYSANSLRNMRVHDLFPPEESQYLTAVYAELAQGGSQRLREPRSLLRADGEQAWVYLAVSVLRDVGGAPSNFVTMVEDISELHLLQERLRYQALHDVMTGLPNRQYLRSRLESALGSLPGETTLTLYHLRLDGFELINDGLGYEVGDTVVKMTARRLERLVGDETAMVARLGGTEFALLVQHSPSTPGMAEMAAMINEELSEPIYVGEHGIATSVSIGVVQRIVGEEEPSDLVWASDVALRWADAAGKGQWALFDPARAPLERSDAKLAAVMPGALELGEFEVVYQPVINLRDDSVAALQAQLSWGTAGSELGHDRCLSLAERSGVTLALRNWLLGRAWEQLEQWHAEGREIPLVVPLSPNQSRDPDLVATVRAVLRDSSLAPEWLRLCVPLSALRGADEEAQENVRVLAELGVRPALHTFGASPEELRDIQDLPVHVLQLSEGVVQLVHADRKAPESRAIAAMVEMVRERGIPVSVGGIETEDQAEHWRSLGCALGVGTYFSGSIPAADVPALLDARN